MPKEPDLEWTGERLVPHACTDPRTVATHLHRYEMASGLCRGKTVLDLACGEGYGSQILARQALDVIGMDIDPPAIAHASRKYRLPNLRFQEGDATRIPLANASVDVVTSFETIEHLADPSAFLLELRRVLAPGGFLLVSTPNRTAYGTRNPHHCREYTRDEFLSLLSPLFSGIRLYGQYWSPCSLLVPCDGSVPAPGPHLQGNFAGSTNSPLPEAAPFLVALCGNGELPRPATGSYSFSDDLLQISEASLFWSVSCGGFEEACKHTQHIVGGRWNLLRFPEVPTPADASGLYLRIDPACHPGSYRLRNLRVLKADGTCVFPPPGEGLLPHLIPGSATRAEECSDGILVEAGSDDPQFYLPSLAPAGGPLRCEVEIFPEAIVIQTSASPGSSTPVYEEDGLKSIHNHDFTSDPDFVRAYARGVRAAEADYQWRWRVHIGLWAARSALLLEGDFVECGVNHGFLGSAIMEALDWDQTGKTFHLFDTFRGPDPSQAASSHELDRNLRHMEKGLYTLDPARVARNFSQWKNVRLVPGRVPESLGDSGIEHVAFLHIDMNASVPEAGALVYFWEKLTPGAFVLLDDYGYRGYEHLHRLGAVVAGLGVTAATLPTGQGLIIKPPAPCPA